MIQYDLKAALIEIEKPVKGLAEILSDAAMLLFRNMLQQISGKHRGEGERHHHRDEDRHREGDREFSEQTPDHVSHEEKRNQHGNKGEGERHNREADFL